MNRNVESHFSLNPTNIDIQRSTFDRSHSVKFSFNVGDLIPFYVDEVLPGDTFNVTSSKVVRMQPLVSAPMDNLFLDTYYFFVPNRLVWSHWREFNGENTESPWMPSVEYSVPQLLFSEDTQAFPGSIADYMGIPPVPTSSAKGFSVSALPFRAYALICNEWFRDENLTDPLVIPTGDSNQQAATKADVVLPPVYALGGIPFKVAKYHDYFTSCLPTPQKGPDVKIPMASDVPVYSGPTINPNPDNKYSTLFVSEFSSNPSLHYKMDTSGMFEQAPIGDTSGLYAGNLYAAMSTSALATINQLRLAFQIQRMYEKDARGGTRYIEILKSHFGVTSPDARLQRPEYLGGNRIPINISQVVQNSGTVSNSTPQGNVAGMSLTADNHSDFTKSFVEHGFVIGVMCARYDHTYQQGIERFWSRKTRFDYYWPVFANIGEQPVLNKEIYADGSAADDEVFGYQEAWADYRYKPNRVCGEMRSNITNSLDVWHFADNYKTRPALSDSWIREDKTNVDRVLAIQSKTSNQLFADIYIKNKTTRPMPLYSVPGLIDHH
nr:MAG: major capsid protein [Microviridae sp.]